MKIIFITLLLTLMALNVHCQQKLNTAGYLGKRATVEFVLGTSYGLSTDFENNAHKRDRLFRLNLHPELTLAYTVKRNMDIGFKVGYDRVKVRFENELAFNFEVGVYSSDLTYYQELDQNQQYFQIVDRNNIGTSFNYQLFLRLYPKKYIAPVGIYHQFSIGVNRISFKDNEIEGYMSDVSLLSKRSEEFIALQTEDPLVIQLRKFNMFEVSYGVGNKKVYKNDWYSNIGFELNYYGKGSLRTDYSFISIMKEEFSYHVPDQNSENYHYYYPKQLAKSIQRSQLIEFKIGIGKIF